MDMMARKIRFALPMGDGAEVRTIEDLRKHFDLYEVVGYYLDGKLVEWLQDRHYENTEKQISDLKITDPDFVAKLCTALKVDTPPVDKVDIKALASLNRKEDEVAQLTSDPEAVSHVKSLACNQDDLKCLLTAGVETIYLLGTDAKKHPDAYTIPLNFPRRTFIGVSGPARVLFAQPVNEEILDGLELKFQNIEYELATDTDEERDNTLLDKIKQVLSFENAEKADRKKRNAVRSRQVSLHEEADSVGTVQTRLVRYLDAGFPIIYLETFEEDKADEIILSVVGGRRVLEWSAQGLWDRSAAIRKDGWSLADTLLYLIRNEQDACKRVIILKDMHSLLKDQLVVARLKKLAQLINAGQLEDTNIVLVSPIVVIPHELENYLTLVHMGHLSAREIQELILEFCSKQGISCEVNGKIREPVANSNQSNKRGKMVLKEQLLMEMVQAFKGLSEFEIGNILALALSGNGEINLADLSLIREQKRQMVQKSGILEMVEVTEKPEDIGGLAVLKKWLSRKAKVFRNIREAAKFGVDMPKGVLVVGMPGCGKSLCAKVTAGLFNMPLLRLDMGKLMGKYVGESEANMRRALNLSEAIAPCVLWIDEMEKAFAGMGNANSSNDVTARMLGAFLVWLQENKSTVYVVATANDIMRMPPELLRKGRFDDVFYIDLPSLAERENIFRIHIGKRRPADLEHIDMRRLAQATEGYSGAGIEGVVSESVETAFAEDKQALATEDVLRVIAHTHSLREMMKEPLDQLERIYKERKFKNASSED